MSAIKAGFPLNYFDTRIGSKYDTPRDKTIRVSILILFSMIKMGLSKGTKLLLFLKQRYDKRSQKSESELENYFKIPKRRENFIF